jgi:hypothetical protein
MGKIAKGLWSIFIADLYPVISNFVGHLNKRHRDITNKNTPPIPADGRELSKSKSQKDLILSGKMYPQEPRLGVEVRKYDDEMIQRLTSKILQDGRTRWRSSSTFGFHFQYHNMPTTPLTPLKERVSLS